MGLLQLVDTTETKTVVGPEGDELILRANIAKRELNNIFKKMPASAFTRDEDDPLSYTIEMAVGTSEALFAALVVGWSLPVPATVENYLALQGPGAAWVDGVLFEHFSSAQMSETERPKPSTSPKGSRKGTEETA